jgi:hypothetical protein
MSDKDRNIAAKLGKEIGISVLKATFLTAAAYWLMSPSEMDFDEDENYEPTDVQAEFLRLAAEKYHYLAMGDTDHRRPIINMFAMNSKTVAALADGGKENIFIELAPYWQPYLGRLSGKDTSDEAQNFSLSYHNFNMWLCSDEIKNSLTENFEKSVSENTNINFIAADYRHTDDSKFDEFLKDKEWVFTKPLEIYEDIYGCVDQQAFIVPGLIMLATGQSDNFKDALSDDTATAKYMKSFEGPSAIFYGAGHLIYKEDDEVAKNNSMRTHLQSDGQNIAVIEIYQDEDQKLLRSDGDTRPDAMIYVIESEDNPDGIKALTPEMEELEKIAIENVKKRRELYRRPIM